MKTKTNLNPLLAIVGRPNVGKSTLFNKIVGSRRAIVGDEPGITRDRLYGKTEWRGRQMRVVDTGGIIPDEKNFIPAEIFRQARVAFEEAAAIVMVVDGRSELTAPDLELARLLQKTGKPLFLAVNKVDSDKQEGLADEFHGLGIRNIFPISAEHGRGLDDLLDAIIEKLQLPVTETAPLEDAAPEVPESADEQEEKDGTEKDGTEDPENAEEQAPEPDHKEAREVKVAIIGHPNVGKSTLLNCLTGTDRSIVSPIPGTTRDAVDEVFEHNGRKFRFIDTAG
ncbi:MAG TPA: ribosome biogenesis GTPase Der, partial [Terriglobales bacterium]